MPQHPTGFCAAVLECRGTCAVLSSSLAHAPAAASLRGTASNPMPLIQALPKLMSLHKQLRSIQSIALKMAGRKTWNKICCSQGPTTPSCYAQQKTQSESHVPLSRFQLQ